MILDGLIKFKANITCGTMQHQNFIGKFSVTLTNPAIKLFLKVCIARSGAFLLYICGGLRLEQFLGSIMNALKKSAYCLSR